MRIVVEGTTTFILLNGIAVQSNQMLHDHIELQKADTSHLDLQTALSTCSHPDDIAVVAAFIPRVTAQLRICAETPKELAARTWNASWDALLLGAVFHAEVGFNLQSDTVAEEISASSKLRATNLHMNGLVSHKPYLITREDANWISKHFEAANELLEHDAFQTAVHCLASYRWHSMPRIKMAVIWAGIEALFEATTEIRFSISIYISRFLFPNDMDARKKTFDKVKSLYNSRSAAVHGAKSKNSVTTAVEDSAAILQQLIVRTVELRSLPAKSELVP